MVLSGCLTKGPIMHQANFCLFSKNICHQLHLTSVDGGFQSNQILVNLTKLQNLLQPQLPQSRTNFRQMSKLTDLLINFKDVTCYVDIVMNMIQPQIPDVFVLFQSHTNNNHYPIQSNLPQATNHNVKDMWSLTGGGRLPEVRPQGV